MVALCFLYLFVYLQNMARRMMRDDDELVSVLVVRSGNKSGIKRM